MGTTTPQADLADRVTSLSDPEQAYITRWVALVHPEVAEEGLEALAEFRRDFPVRARMFLGAETNGRK